MTKENLAVFGREDRKKDSPKARLRPLLVVLGLSLGSLALAQAPPAATDNSQPLFYPAPPTGFDAVNASDADLATYGFPQRPPQGDPSYTKWATVMANAKQRLQNPTARSTGVFHSPKGQAEVVNGLEYSANWSGVDEVYSHPFFASNNNGYGSIVVGGWDQPSIGSENCSYGPYYMSTWVGFDGTGDAIAGNNDVLQAGFNAVACPTQNYAWYEWYTQGCTVNTAQEPCGEWMVNLPVSPGNDLYVTVTYHTSSPNGTAFLENQTTGQYIAMNYNQPPGASGSSYAGYAAEWIVERPGRSLSNPSSYYDLPDYYLPGGPNNNQLWLYPSYLNFPSYYPPGLDTSGTFNVIDMYCDPSDWNPSSACPLVNGGGQYISVAQYWSYYQTPPSGYGTEVLYFFAYGPAASQ